MLIDVHDVVSELDRSAYLPLAGDQVGTGSVWSPEKTDFCLQILPQVLHMSDTYMMRLAILISFCEIP